MKTITIDGIEYELTPKEKEDKNKWRLPTVNELIAMYDYNKGKPEIEGFSSYYYWSSTTKEGYPSYAWYVYFSSGYVNYNNKGSSNYVRCVRDTNKGLVWSEFSKFKMTWDEAIEYAENLEE